MVAASGFRYCQYHKVSHACCSTAIIAEALVGRCIRMCAQCNRAISGYGINSGYRIAVGVS